jgi:hypothetical protein
VISLEQAIFVADPTAETTGYHLAGSSARICEQDARELIAWGPSNGATLTTTVGQWSLSFHPLPSGAQAISRTALLGGQAGPASRVYTHTLIAGPEALSRFACNPFSLLRATMAANPLGVFEQVPERLASLQLAGRAAAVDQVLLARLAANPGPKWTAQLVQSALDSICLVIVGGPPAEALISGLMSCLPPECRNSFSFTTGLGFSPDRPFRIIGHPGPLSDVATLAERYNVQILDLSDQPPDEHHSFAGWPRLVERVLATGRTAFLAAQLSKRRFDLQTNDLPSLGEQLLEDLDASALRTDPVGKNVPTAIPNNVASVQHSHAAHRRPCESGGSATRTDGPSKHLHPDSEEVLEKLESLDDAVFDAIAGNPESLEMLKTLWPRIRDELGEDLVAESREQYLRYALSVWDEYAGCGGVRDPSRATRAMDVLCVFFDRI